MLESVLIQNFNGFRDTRIDGFRPVNLIIGGQNVGKTSLLEAVLFALRREVSTAFRQSEGDDESRLIEAVATRRDLLLLAKTRHGEYGVANKGTPSSPSAPASTPESRTSNGGRFRLFTPDAELFGRTSIGKACLPVPLFLPPQSELVTLTGKLILSRKKQDLIKLLREVEPRLLSLDAIAPDGEQRVYAELDGLPQALPLSHLGHGFSRLVHLFSELLVSDARLALIDEIENGIHYSALPTLFQGIQTVARERQVQTLMTTHSWDALRAASEVFADTPELFQVIRLERTPDDNVQAIAIDGPRLQRLIEQDREVR